MTVYVILQGSLPDDSWEEFARVEATAPETAIRKAVSEPGDGERFVAVPERSFQPMTFQVETKTTVRLASGSEAEPVASRKADADHADDIEPIAV